MDSFVTEIQCVWRVEERAKWKADSEGDLAEEQRSVEQVKRICRVRWSRPVSVLWAPVDNRIKLTVDRATNLEYWVYERAVVSCECSVLITDYFSCFNFSVNRHCYLLNLRVYLLQY
jgi:hypothetical protein